MQYFYVDIINGQLRFSQSDIKHITKVLRKKVNDEINCYNLESKTIFNCKIKSISPFSINVLNKKANINFDSFNINVYVGVIKKNSIELITKILNEINVSSLNFVWCEFSQRNNYIDFNRLNNIIIESCKQSNRLNLLKINKPISFCDMLSLIDKDNSFCAHLYEDNITFNDFSLLEKNKNFYKEKGINLLIGPEAGFSKKEISILKNKVNFVKLTPTILKSETATIFLSSIFVKMFL